MKKAGLYVCRCFSKYLEDQPYYKDDLSKAGKVTLTTVATGHSKEEFFGGDE